MPSFFFSNFFGWRSNMAVEAEPYPVMPASSGSGQDSRSSKAVDIDRKFGLEPTIVEKTGAGLRVLVRGIIEEEMSTSDKGVEHMAVEKTASGAGNSQFLAATQGKEKGVGGEAGSSESPVNSFDDKTGDEFQEEGDVVKHKHEESAFRRSDVDKGKKVEIDEAETEFNPSKSGRLERGEDVQSIASRTLKSGRFSIKLTKSDLSTSTLLSQFLEVTSPKTSDAQTSTKASSVLTSRSFRVGDKNFTCPETIPSADICFKEFEEQYPKYVETADIDKLRKEHYAHLQDAGHVCLDYCGYGLFSHFQQVQNKAFSSFGLAYISANLAAHALYGAANAESAEGCIRQRVMQYLNISDTEYSMVFTASRGSAFKLLAESYPFHVSGRLLTVYDHDSESVKWMVDSARQRGAKVMSALFKWPSLRVCSATLKKQIKGRWHNVPAKKRRPMGWNKLVLSLLKRLTGLRKYTGDRFQEQHKMKDVAKGLFVFPLQSRVSGSKMAHQWMSYAQQNKWHVLLDASALGAKEMSSLGLSLLRPDFIVASFFKVFGADPTGFGCLFIKNSVMPYLQSSHRARGVGMVRIVPYGSYVSPVSSPPEGQQKGPAESDEVEQMQGRVREKLYPGGSRSVLPGSLYTGVSSFSGPVKPCHQLNDLVGPSGLLSENYVGYGNNAYMDDKSDTSSTTFPSGSLYASGSLPTSSTLYPSGSFHTSSSVFPSGALFPSGGLHTPNGRIPYGGLFHLGASQLGESGKYRRHSLQEGRGSSQDVGFSGPISGKLKLSNLGENQFARTSYSEESPEKDTVRKGDSLASSSSGKLGREDTTSASLNRKEDSLGSKASEHERENSGATDEYERPESSDHDQMCLEVKRFSSSVPDKSGTTCGEHQEKTSQSGDNVADTSRNQHERRDDNQFSGVVWRENSIASSSHDMDGTSEGDSFATPQGELADTQKDSDSRAADTQGMGDDVGLGLANHTSIHTQHVAKSECGACNSSHANLHDLASKVSASFSQHHTCERSVGSEEEKSSFGSYGEAICASGFSSKEGFFRNVNGTTKCESSRTVREEESKLRIKESAVSRETEKAYEMLGCRDRQAQRRLLVINREIAEMGDSGSDTYDPRRDSSSQLGSSRRDILYNIQETSATPSEASSQGGSGYLDGLEGDEGVADTSGAPEPVVFCQSLDHADFMGLNRTNLRLRCLGNWLIQSLLKLQHPDGRYLVHVYGPSIKIDRGPAIALNVFDWNGNLVQPGLVQRLADRSNIALGMGSLSNIEIPDDVSLIPGLILKKGRKQGETGRIRVVTASLGFMSNFEDVYRLWHFVAKFLDVDFLFREVWRYHGLNQETVVLGDGSMGQDRSETG